MTAIRRHNYAKWNTRRFNAYDTVDSFREVSRWQGPLYRFCCTDSRLIVLFWIDRFADLLRRWRWHGDQHNCSCITCRCDTRKVKGNAWKARPISERKLIEAMNSDPSEEPIWDPHDYDDLYWMIQDDIISEYEEAGGVIGGRGPRWWQALSVAHTPTGSATIGERTAFCEKTPLPTPPAQ